MTKTLHPLLGFALGLAGAAGLAGAPPAAAEELAIPLSHPGQPVVLEASGLQAQFTVEGYDGQQVLIDFTSEDGDERKSRHEAPPGMRRLSGAGSGLEAEEENNRVRVSVDGQSEQHVRIRVPRTTSVHVSSVNGEDMVIRGVTGEHELQHVNGGITATDVSGTVVAHTTNGDVKVTLGRTEAGKPMSFVSFNGDVDVTFPPGLAASLTMRSDNGDVFTDFDVDVRKSAPTKREDRSGGRYRVSVEKSMKATVGGGGPEITLRTFNGDIYLRKRG